MRVEIDTRDLVSLVKQFTVNYIPDEDMLADIEEMLTYYTESEDFEYEIDITEL